MNHCNPTTILALLDVIEVLREGLEKYEEKYCIYIDDVKQPQTGNNAHQALAKADEMVAQMETKGEKEND